VTYHKNIRARKIKRSILEDVPGIGKKKSAILLKHFGGIKKIKSSTVEQIASVPGITVKDAHKVRAFLRKRMKNSDAV